jgi:hypothetical protein
VTQREFLARISRQAVIKTLLGRALSEERQSKPRSKKAG